MDTARHFETRYLNRMISMLDSAFEQACSDEDMTAAEELLCVLETLLCRAAAREEHRERSMSVLQAALSRMWIAKQSRRAPPFPAHIEARKRNPAIEAYDVRHIVVNEARQAL